MPLAYMVKYAWILTETRNQCTRSISFQQFLRNISWYARSTF